MYISLLIIALSIDTLACSFAYGVNKISIPISSCLLINFICTSIFVMSILLGYFIHLLIPNTLLSYFSFAILFILGLTKIFENYLKFFINKFQDFKKKINFSFFNLRFVLDIYVDPNNADINYSKDISLKEAFYLSLALSLDSICSGFSISISSLYLYILIFLSSFIIGNIALILGSSLGKHFSKISSLNISWISGIILIVLAILKLI